jgi:hydroxymethylpyrimidine pyrophosphatase-like HAD family hydrolase
VPEADDTVARWSRLGARLAPSTIRVVLADIDGVISGGEGAPIDPTVLERLAAWNDAALADPSLPAIALCTGRQAPYVELLAQLTHTFLPCIFEHGAGMLEPRAFRFSFNPVLGSAPWRAVAQIRELLDEPLLAPGRAFVQPGKEATLTLYPVAGATVAEVAVLARAALAEEGVDFRVVANIRGVELRPPGIDKGAGARWLTGELGIPLERFAGVGDADDDLAFLELVGFPATPANGSPAVRAMARYVAAKPFGDGLLEILDHLAAVNGSN